MADFTEVIPAADLKAHSAPPKFQSAVSTIEAPSASEEAQMREMFSGVTMDNLDDPVKQAAPTQGQLPVNTTVKEQPKNLVMEVPSKFQKPDGTVDEEKLKASSDQLGKAIEQKQTSIDEMLAKYKDQEKQFTELGAKAKQLKETSPTPPVQEPQQIPTLMAQNLPPAQIRAQLLQLQQDDPIAFAVEIARAVARKEATDIAQPALEVTGRLAERERDTQMRTNLVDLAQKDSRVQNPEMYAELINELNSDPAYFRLKNPLKSAWNEVKERLRLGEPTGSAQPSQASGPILGRGVPPSVSSLPQPMSQSSVRDAVYDPTLSPFSKEGKQLEEQLLKNLAEQAWRG